MIVLKEEDIVPLLLRHHLLKEEHLVEGAVDVINVSRRNWNFQVTNEKGPSYFIKQGVGSEKRRTVAHEAKVYQFFHFMNDYLTCLEFLPRYYLYDPDECILVLESLPGAQTVTEHCRRYGRFSHRLAKSLGRVLGSFHRAARTAKVRSEYDRLFSSRLPFGLSIQRADMNVFRYSSQACIDLMKIVQQSTQLCEGLDVLYQGWNADTLIHADIRWDNCSVLPSWLERGKAGVTILDWELAGCGDSCWDVGTMFSEYLSLWLGSAPLSEDTPPEHFLRFARHPLDKIKPAIQSFWDAYTEHARLNAAELAVSLLRAVKYAAARLVQTAFERVQMATQVSGNAIFLLQLGINILERPRAASAQLLGLPIL
jgi:hypothetical protein